MSYVSGAVLLLAFVWIIWVHGLPADFFARNAFNWPGFLSSISSAALWQIAYAPYVSDYSRYMPRDTGAVPAFWASYWGCTLGSLLPMLLACGGLGRNAGSWACGGGAVGTLGAPFRLRVDCAVGEHRLRECAESICGALSTLTFGQTLFPAWSPGSRARTIISIVLFAFAMAGALLSKESFSRTMRASF